MRTAVVAGLIAGGLAGAPVKAHAAPDSAIVVDAKTGKVLYSNNADGKRYPASLTKMMTLYMLFEALESGRVTMDSRIKFSAQASAQAPSKLGLKPGQSISVKEAILALVTKSANDVACAVGETLAGSERTFALRMTAKAKALGMTNTTFRNASGLPNTSQVTTARDMATLGRALKDHFPQYYHYFSTASFTFKGKRMRNHNRLLGRVKGVTGIKTGYTRASGFNLVASVETDNRYLVAVVIGGETSKWRDAHMAELIRKYLPKASRGPRTAAFMPGRNVAAAIPLDEYPLPRLRPTAQGPMTTGSVASVVGANSIFALADTAEGDALAEDDVEPAPVEQTEAEPAVAEVAMVAQSDEGAAPAPTSTNGWKIQLAATPTKASALEILTRARAKGDAVLASASPYTEPVAKGDVTLYRARFAGFANKGAAQAACKHLTKRDFDCFALSD